jgi:hypothetical protein
MMCLVEPAGVPANQFFDTENHEDMLNDQGAGMSISNGWQSHEDYRRYRGTRGRTTIHRRPGRVIQRAASVEPSGEEE